MMGKNATAFYNQLTIYVFVFNNYRIEYERTEQSAQSISKVKGVSP